LVAIDTQCGQLGELSDLRRECGELVVRDIRYRFTKPGPVFGIKLEGEIMARIKAKERSADEKAAIVMALLSGTSASELVRKHAISESALSKWRTRFIEGGRSALAVNRRTVSGADSALEAENQQLKEALANAVVQNELLKKAYRA